MHRVPKNESGSRLSCEISEKVLFTARTAQQSFFDQSDARFTANSTRPSGSWRISCRHASIRSGSEKNLYPVVENVDIRDVPNSLDMKRPPRN